MAGEFLKDQQIKSVSLMTMLDAKVFCSQLKKIYRESKNNGWKNLYFELDKKAIIIKGDIKVKKLDNSRKKKHG